MKVSIITPVHNTEEYLAETIESVLAQSHDDWELLLSGDHSTTRRSNSAIWAGVILPTRISRCNAYSQHSQPISPGPFNGG